MHYNKNLEKLFYIHAYKKIKCWDQWVLCFLGQGFRY